MTAVCTLIVHVFIIMISLIGIYGAKIHHFLLLICFVILNTFVLIASFITSSVRGAIVLVQVAVTALSLSMLIGIQLKVRQEIRLRKKQQKILEQKKSNLKNDQIDGGTNTSKKHLKQQVKQHKKHHNNYFITNNNHNQHKHNGFSKYYAK